MKFINVLAFLLVLVGAINWGLWGFFQYDLVAHFCGGNASSLSRFIYGIIGLSGVWSLKLIPRCCHFCCHSCKCSSSNDNKKGGCCH